MKTYFIRKGCRWVSVTTTETVWRLTPKFRGALIGGLFGCGVGVGINALPPIEDVGPRWPVVHPSPPTNIPEPDCLFVLVAGAVALWRIRK